MFTYKKPSVRKAFLKAKRDDKEKNVLRRVHEFLAKYESEIITGLLFAWNAASDDLDSSRAITALTTGNFDDFSENYILRINQSIDNTIHSVFDGIGKDGFAESYIGVKNMLESSAHYSAEYLNLPEPQKLILLPEANNINSTENLFDYNVIYDRWCDKRAADLIVDITDTQRNNVRQIIRQYLNNDNPEFTVNRIRDTIGLTNRQLEQNKKYFENIIFQQNGGSLENPPQHIVDYARKAAKKAADKKRYERAKSIARTEINAAHHNANEAYMRWAIEHGYINGLKRQWVTSGNDNVCPICLMLEGQTVDFDEDFSSEVFFFGNQKKLPPVHTNCCCGIIYVESNEKSVKDGIWNNMTAAEKKAHANYFGDKKQYLQYVEQLGKENIPETLAEFQKIKYNDTEKYSFIKLDYKRQNKLLNNPSLMLPNARIATADVRKFTGYLFNPDNAEGWAKGKAFTSRLGYNIENYADLKEAILKSADKYPSTFKSKTEYGSRYEQKIILYGNKGTPANVVVGWLCNDKSTKMTSAYIKEVK